MKKASLFEAGFFGISKILYLYLLKAIAGII